jgi:hypothetical protein
MIVALAALAAAQTAEPSRISALGSFVGSCWAADFTPTMTDTHCFETMYDGAHIRDRHEVKEKGKSVYAGETIYSGEGNEAVFTYFNSMGGVGHGTFQQHGATLHFKGSMRASPVAAPQPIDSQWRVIDSDHYDVRSLVKSPSTGANPALRFSRVK